MKTIRTFNLTRKAKKSGGDRYEDHTVNEDPIVFYLPQYISRDESGKVRESLTITIEGN
jgi:hypothetical protein